MNKRVCYGLVLLFVVGLLFTGCITNKGKKLECTKTSNEGLELYGEATINTAVVFDGKGKVKSTNVELIADINKIESSEE